MATISFRGSENLVYEYEAIAEGLDIDKSELYRTALEYYLNSLPDLCTVDDIQKVKMDSLSRKLNKYNSFEIFGCVFCYERIEVSYGRDTQSELEGYVKDEPIFKMKLTELERHEEDIVTIEGYRGDDLCFKVSIPLVDLPNIKVKQ